LLVDLDRIERDQNLLGRILTKVRYGRLGALTIYLITGGAEIRAWAEKVRDAFSKNFDVTIYLYPIESLEKGVKKVIDSCSADNIVYIYKEIPEEHLKSVQNSCKKIEII